MKLGSVNKAIFAGGAAGYAAYQTAASNGAGLVPAIIVGGSVALVIGFVTYLVPNAGDPNAVTIKDLIALVESALGVPVSARTLPAVESTPAAAPAPPAA